MLFLLTSLLTTPTRSYRYYGALTNKPAAFSFRAWELESVRTFDVLDPFLTPLSYDIRGFTPLRVLPHRGPSSDLGWLTDRTRFAFTGLKYQRQSELVIRSGFTSYLTSWPLALGWLTTLLLQVKQSTWGSVVGRLLGRTFSLVSAKVSTKKLDRIHLEAFEGVDERDLRLNSFLFRSVGVSSYSGTSNFSSTFTPALPLFNMAQILLSEFLVVGVDIRYEFPRFNILLRRKIRTATARVWYIGARSVGVYPDWVTNLGSTSATWYAILTGRHWVNGLLAKSCASSRFVLIGVGGGALCANLLAKFCAQFSFQSFTLYPTAEALGAVFWNFRTVPSFISRMTAGGLFRSTTVAASPQLYIRLCGGLKGKAPKTLFPRLVQVSYTPFILPVDAPLPSLTLPGTGFLERNFTAISAEGAARSAVAVTAAPTTETGIRSVRAWSEIVNAILCISSLKLPRPLFSLGSVLQGMVRFIAPVFDPLKLTDDKEPQYHFISRVHVQHGGAQPYLRDIASSHALVLNIAATLWGYSTSNYLYKIT